MGPAYAVPKALERAGIAWSELGLVEIHEAFAAQVLSNVQAWASREWAERLGLLGPGGRSGLGAHQRHGRVDRHRTSVRARRERGWSRRSPTRCAAAPCSSADLHLRARWDGRSPWCWSATSVARSPPPSTNGIAVVTFDLPGEPVNKLSAAVKNRVRGPAHPSSATKPAIRAAVLISGKPDTFIAGADIEEFTALTTGRGGATELRAGRSWSVADRDPRQAGGRRHPRRLLWAAAWSWRSPAAIAWRPTTRRTQLGLPEVQLGLIPGAGGCERLPRLVGARAALDLILSGKSERAAKALRIGLVDEVVPRSILASTALAAADRLARDGLPARASQTGIRGLFLDRTATGRRFVYRARGSAGAEAHRRPLSRAARRTRGR